MGESSNSDPQSAPSTDATAAKQASDSMQAAMTRLNSGEVSGNDLMQVIHEFDNGLRALKALYTERQFLQAKLQQQEVDFLMRESEINEKAADVEARRAVLESEKNVLAEQRAELEKRGAVLTEAKSAAERATREAQHAAETARMALEAREHELRGREEGTKRRGEEIEKQRREIEEQRRGADEQRRAVEEARAQFQRREADLGAAATRITALEGELLKAREEQANANRLADERAKRIEGAEGQARELESRLQEALSKAGQSEAATKGQREQLAQRAEELQRLLSESEKGLAAERDRAQHLADLLEHRTEELSGVEKVIEGLKERLRNEVDQRNESEFKAEELTEQIEKLATQLQQAQDRVDSAERTPGFGSSNADEWLLRRKHRIRAARTAIRNKIAKLKKGEDAIHKRFQQCEQILSQRAELAAAHTAVIQQQRRVQNMQAKGRAGVAVLCVAVSLMLLAALSWAISREVTPGVFIAKTTIHAEGRNTEMNQDALNEWQAYHQKLLKDPRLADSIAGRMKQKHIESLAQPGAVVARMKEDMSSDSSRPGEIILELRGAGKQRTERELDTIATAFASEANATRDTRADGGITSVPVSSSAGDGPIDNIQLFAAAGIMGFGVILFLFLGIAIWRRLANAKTKFEQDVQLASILDSAHWPDPRATATPGAPGTQTKAMKAAA